MLSTRSVVVLLAVTVGVVAAFGLGRLPSATRQGYASVMAETKDPHRERIEELGRMNTIYSERPWHDWKPGKPPKHDKFTHDVPRQIDDEHPDKPDRD